MDLPLYQKHLIEAMRSGCKLWMDDLGNVTYHIKIRNAVKNVTSPTIEALKWRGLIKENGNDVILTDLGKNGELVTNGKEIKTLYKI